MRAEGDYYYYYYYCCYYYYSTDTPIGKVEEEI